MMTEKRLVRKGETDRLKEIWKRCFGDPDGYINFYFANRYQENETAVLLCDGEIASMLTMLPGRLVLPDHRCLNTVMLYAIATHPNYQNRGFAAELMDFSYEHLKLGDTDLTVLVPASQQLFNFYRKLGYHEGFNIRETVLTRAGAEALQPSESGFCRIFSVTPEEYNRRRNKLLSGRFYISYSNQDLAYQKKLSEQTGADLYALDISGAKGCFAAERMSSDKVMIKEILAPEELINSAIRSIIEILPAHEYVLRMPGHLGKNLDSEMRPFGMLRALRELDLALMPKEFGYLGFAFD